MTDFNNDPNYELAMKMHKAFQQSDPPKVRYIFDVIPECFKNDWLAAARAAREHIAGEAARDAARAARDAQKAEFMRVVEAKS